jgi:hypothetical protein
MSTMDHLVVANLVAGNDKCALKVRGILGICVFFVYCTNLYNFGQLLKKMFDMQSSAFGPNDVKCLTTSRKISMLQENKLKDVVTKQLDAAFDEICKTEEKLVTKSKGNKTMFNFFKSKKRTKGAVDP